MNPLMVLLLFLGSIRSISVAYLPGFIAQDADEIIQKRLQ